MTEKQFEALAKLIRLRGGVSQEAARLVLVEGRQQVEVAAVLNTTPQAVANVIRRCKTAIELAKTVSDEPDER
ncbi:TrfB-related DNA-binding protein [Halopseudomonas phragmitis]|uniref:TrfB transcriptional repressor protein domain-containing protein n=1 Tax=Halopseudomonas phragmitis TaxID=1931241 RepID=A0A1V0B6A6_9GAMM|nr:TrfB-related DNA-binding protein [Halopseudomonas phragmitis]AQZ95449.1 hypothetical protein BVH74_12120 [Halopseudomonas phragmitis]